MLYVTEENPSEKEFFRSIYSYREHDDVGRLHGVLWRKDDPAVVDTALEL